MPHMRRRLVKFPTIRCWIGRRTVRIWIENSLPQYLPDNGLIPIDARADTGEVGPVLGQHVLVLAGQAVEVIHGALQSLAGIWSVDEWRGGGVVIN